MPWMPPPSLQTTAAPTAGLQAELQFTTDARLLQTAVARPEESKSNMDQPVMRPQAAVVTAASAAAAAASLHTLGKAVFGIEVTEREQAGNAPAAVEVAGVVTGIDGVQIREMEGTETGTGVLMAAAAGAGEMTAGVAMNARGGTISGAIGELTTVATAIHEMNAAMLAQETHA